MTLETDTKPEEGQGPVQDNYVYTRSASNMATTQLFQMVKQPPTYQVGDDVENAIKDFQRYFELTNLPKEQANMFARCFLSPEAEEEYKNRPHKELGRKK